MHVAFHRSVSKNCQISKMTLLLFLCPRYSKNGGGALSVTHVRACMCVSVRYQKDCIDSIQILYVDI